jgi:sec-independent protein translocase protein TatB
MNIFGIGGAELVLVILIAIVVAGPKRMIVWAYQAGRLIGKLRRQWEQVAEVLQKEVDAAGIEAQVPRDLPNRQNITRMVTQAMKPAMDEVDKAARDVQQQIDPVQGSVQGLQRDLNQTGQEVTRNVRGALTKPVAASSPVIPLTKAKPAATPPAAPAAGSASAPALGTWGGAAPAAPEAPALGTWGGAPATPPETDGSGV